MDRIILHCDCNSFFASVECVSHPEYKSVPMAVCGDPDNRHGIVLAKNEIAKKYGIVTAETVWSAKRKCSDLIVVMPHYEEYVKFSAAANEIYGRYTDLVEPFSIDESWLDVTGSIKLFGDGKQIAEQIRESIKRELGITISVGVSFNKIFAKMGSDYKKPDAVTVISRDNFRDILYPLSVSELIFVGKSCAKTLAECNIRTIGDIAASSPEFLRKKLGKQGEMIYRYATGQDTSEVIPPDKNEDSKSIGNGMTFSRDITSDSDIKLGIESLADEVAMRLRRHHMKATVISLTVKDSFLSQVSRQTTVHTPMDTAREMAAAAYSLYKKMQSPGKAVRMLTVTAFGLVHSDEVAEQLNFFDDNGQRREKTRKLETTVDDIRKKFGKGSITSGAVLNNDFGLNMHSKSNVDKESYKSQTRNSGENPENPTSSSKINHNK